MFLAYISQYLLPHSMDSSNLYYLLTIQVIHLIYLDFSPSLGMSQWINFTFSYIFSPFIHIASKLHASALNISHIELILCISIYLQIHIFNSPIFIVTEGKLTMLYHCYSMNTIKQPDLKNHFHM